LGRADRQPRSSTGRTVDLPSRTFALLGKTAIDYFFA
jgi:hypothetical protein